MRGKVEVAAVLTALWMLSGAVEASGITWEEIWQDRVREINSDLRPGVPTADIGIYLPSNLDTGFAVRFSADALLEEVVTAKKVFAEAGVQLNLLWVRTGRIPEQYLEIQANDLSRETPASDYVNLYVDAVRQRSGLSAEAREAFEAIIEPHPDNDRTIYIVILQNVFMSFYERVDERSWQVRTIRTGGLSFPSYSYIDMPRRLRGVITVSRNDAQRKVVAHELGHKLLNVSHEYRDIDPQHEVRAEGGLMLYGAGTAIESGPEGRWHRERLHLSPYLYRLSADGTKIWNADYQEGGHYYDPIYGDKVVHFDPRPHKPDGH